jgi:serine/threonine protein kinase/Tol biopolymer transport system component/tetratricopeptide (TPR) repeat protein
MMTALPSVLRLTPQRWQQIKQLLDRALDEPADQREAFVRAHSKGDEELYAEVFSLLASHKEADDFLEPRTAGAASEPETDGGLEGTRLGAYQLVREIGRGGMGSVYLAVRADQEFRKRVAIKLIRGEVESHFAIRRFRNERQILAQLEHANIARLIDGGTTADGHPYFVMEYVEGDSFLAYCRTRALSVHDRISIFQSVCAAVEHAHRCNVIHRDIKPGNILVTADGTPKLLDFGIAKCIGAEPDETGGHSTLTGFRPMTPAYASPEQLRGQPATIRSDIYSLGVVLWEALSGELPRGEESIASFDAAKAGVPPAERALMQRVAQVVRGAVREDPAERYGSVEAFAEELRRAANGEDGPFPHYRSSPGALPENTPGNSIAVVPFQLLTSEPTTEAYLGAAIADAVIIRLSHVERIVVRPTSSVMRLSPGVDAMTAGRELKVRFVLEGRVQKAAERIRVTVQLIAVENGTPAFATSFDEPAGDLLSLEDSISAQVAHAVIPQLTGEERRELARQGTRSAKAHQAYLHGRWHWSRHSEDALPQALLYFTEAVVEDPEYARAHAGIADYHIALGIRGVLPPKESFAAAIHSARRAVELDPRLAEAHASLGLALWARDGDYATAEHHLQMAITLHSDYAPAHDWFGLLKLAQGKAELGFASLERARSLEPASTVFTADLAMAHYCARHYREAIACFDRTGEPPAVVSGSTLALALVAANQPQKAVEAARQYAAAVKRTPLAVGALAVAEAAAGDVAQARALLDELTARARDYYVSGIALALAEMACGHHNRAIKHLQRALEEADWWAMYLWMPVWDPLLDQTAFTRLVKRARLRSKGRSRLSLAAAAMVLLAASGTLLYSRLSSRPAFEAASMSRLTAGGSADSTAISPDGRQVAWASHNNGVLTVWVRDIETGARRQVAGPLDGMLLSLTFARGGQDVAFVVRPVNKPSDAALHIIGADGRPRSVVAAVPSPLSIAPDESRIAFYRSNGDTDELAVADLDAAHGTLLPARPIYSRRHPDVFSERAAPSWSPDGRTLACIVNSPFTRSHGLELILAGLDGKVRRLDTTPWQKIVSVAWAPGGSGLMIAGDGAQAGFRQVWYVPIRGGAPAHITNDMDDYASLSAASEKEAAVAIQEQSIANLYVLETGAAVPVQITQGGGRYSDVSWTPDGRIVYASDSTGSQDIWVVDANGNQRQLTHGPGRSYGAAVSPDGRTLAFHSNRDGAWNIWTVAAEGGEPVRVTRDASDSMWPSFTVDGSGLVYQHLGPNALYSIWKQPLSGGPAQQVTTAHTMYPTVSEEGRLAYWYCQNPSDARWSIAVLEPRGEVPEHFFSFPPDRMPQVLLRWVPGSSAISYIENRQGVSNIWIQPLDGSPARQATFFTSGHIYSFDWSRDGRLVYSQGTTTGNVVLIRGRQH